MKFILFEKRHLRGRRWHWKLVADNNEQIASGGQGGHGYKHKASAEAGIALVRKTGDRTEIVERPLPKPQPRMRSMPR
jgi:uncharacterized protein YegP (UPF0339 family)